MKSATPDSLILVDTKNIKATVTVDSAALKGLVISMVAIKVILVLLTHSNTKVSILETSAAGIMEINRVDTSKSDLEVQ